MTPLQDELKKLQFWTNAAIVMTIIVLLLNLVVLWMKVIK